MKKLVLIAFTFSFLMVNAQNFQGKAFYKTKMKMTIKMDSTQVDNAQKKQINEMLIKQMEKEYELIFDKEQSVYKEQESLEGIQQGGIQIIMAGGSDILYRNTKEERFVNQNEFFGKSFLVKDKAKKMDWKLKNESKKIGNYTCYKATTTKEIENISRSINKNGKVEELKETKKVTITAWYAPQIPVAHGPSTYWGLPGLILEINDGSQVMICNKIVLNPKDKLRIIAPRSGKEVDQKTYDKIVKKKLKEMEKTFDNTRKKGNSKTINIKIGG